MYFNQRIFISGTGNHSYSIKDDSTSPNEINKTDTGMIFGITIGVLVALIILVGFCTYVMMIKRKSNCDQYTGEKDVNKNGQRKNIKNDKKPQPTRRIPLKSIFEGNVLIPCLDEFNNLMKYDGGIGQRYTTAQGVRYNKIGKLNLIPSNLPFDHNRI